MSIVWTPEKDAAITSGREAGRSASQLAAQIGTTRNAVIGRWHRLSLPPAPLKPRPVKAARPRGPFPFGRGRRAKPSFIVRGVERRYFSADEEAYIRREYAAYTPTAKIATALGRSNGALRQFIMKLGLTRSGVVSKALQNPDYSHLLPVFRRLGAESFMEAVAEWCAQALARQREARAMGERAALEAAKAIDALPLARNQKILRKRALGLTLEQIGHQHGITRERVRQIEARGY